MTKHPFIEACFRRPTPFTPLWIMRQAGRYMPQYQEVRGQVDFLTLCKTPELAAKVTLLAVEVLGVDAAILFSDILIPLEPMGVKVTFEDKIGPQLFPVIRDEAALKKLRAIEPEEDVPFVLEAVRQIREGLDDRAPLIGFSGSPFTLATYMAEGGTSKDFRHIKTLLYSRPDLADQLMDLLAQVVTSYLNAQIAAGVQAVQIFDTWGGILSGPDFFRFSLKPVKKVIAHLKRKGIPVIYYINNGAHLTPYLEGLEVDVLGIDWRQDLGALRKTLGRKMALQGNLDPVVLFSGREEIQDRTRRLLEEAGPEPGHVFNLGHGILPQTPMENALTLVETVHAFKR